MVSNKKRFTSRGLTDARGLCGLTVSSMAGPIVNSFTVLQV